MYSLSNLTFEHQLILGALACERMLPAYDYFYKAEKWGNTLYLRNILENTYSFILGSTNGPLIKSGLIAEISAITPDLDNFDSPLASYAFDTGVAFGELIEFIRSKELDYLQNVLSSVNDTLDMFVQELEDLDPSNPGLDEIIASHEYIEREQNRQAEIMLVLNNSTNADQALIVLLRKLNLKIPLIDLNKAYPI